MATDTDEIKSAITGLKTATDEVKSFAEKATTEIKNLGKMTDETKESADKALSSMNEIKARLDEFEQKHSRKTGDAPAAAKSFGAQVVEGEEIKAALARGHSFRGTARIEIKATTPITTGSATGTSASTALVVADRQGMVALPQYPLTIRDLIAPGNTTSGNIEYPRETVFDNGAAPVAEAGMRAQSDIKFDLVNTPVQTLGHWMSASKQVLADSSMLSSIIDQRLRYGLALAEDAQLLLGDGVTPHLSGIMALASAYAAPAGVTVVGETRIDRLRLAILQATLALLPASAIVLNPTDWAGIEVVKDSQGRYIFANPQGVAAPVMWGLPVATSFSMPSNNFLTGGFRTAAQIFDRDTVSVTLSTEDRSNFVTGMVTILAEERLALAVYRPAAFIKGVFTP